MRCPMATDDMGNMRECRPDCGWLVHGSGSAACAVTTIAACGQLAAVFAEDFEQTEAIKEASEAIRETSDMRRPKW